MDIKITFTARGSKHEINLSQDKLGYIGNCPLHDDEDKSFIVRNDRYYCFTCHERGAVEQREK